MIRSTSRQYTRPKCSPPISENSTTGARRTTRCSDSTAPSSLWPCHASHPSNSTTRPAPDALHDPAERCHAASSRSAGRPLRQARRKRSVAPSPSPRPRGRRLRRCRLRCSRAEGGARSRTCESSPGRRRSVRRRRDRRRSQRRDALDQCPSEVGDPPARYAARPNAINPRSCCSPGRQARSARAAPAAAPASRKPEQAATEDGGRECSCAMEASPRCHRSPSSCRYRKHHVAEQVEARRARGIEHAWANGSSNASSAAPRSPRRRGIDAERFGLVWALGRERRRFGRGEPVGEMALHAARAQGRLRDTDGGHRSSVEAGADAAAPLPTPRRSSGLTPVRLLSSPMRRSPVSKMQ